MTYCAEEEMEAYRMHNQRSFDPMAAFLSGGDDVVADTVGCDFRVEIEICLKCSRTAALTAPVLQAPEKPKEPKEKGSRKQRQQ